jgi:hypothetical protein
MSAIFEPLLAIFAIVVPLGLAYAIIFLQDRKSNALTDPQQFEARIPEKH